MYIEAKAFLGRTDVPAVAFNSTPTFESNQADTGGALWTEGSVSFLDGLTARNNRVRVCGGRRGGAW